MSVSDRVRQKWRESTGASLSGKRCPTDLESMPWWHDPERIARTIARRELIGQWTYFIGWKGGPVKIGRAADPVSRMREIQTGCPYRVHLWAVSSYPMHAEPRLHNRFCEHRLMREWFSWHPDLEAMMASLNGVRTEQLALIRQGLSAETQCGRFVNNSVDSP